MAIKFNMKYLPFVIAGFVAVLLSVGAFFLCAPFLKQGQAAREKEKMYAQEVVFTRDLLATRHSAGTLTQLIAKDKVVLATEAITRLAEQNGVTLTSLRPSGMAKEGGENYRRALLDTDAISSLKGLGSFLSAVRNMPQGIVDVENLRIWPDENVGTEKVTAKITFILLVAKDNG